MVAQLATVGSNLAPNLVFSPDTVLPVELTWTALEAPRKDYTGFVHLVNKEGRLASQIDHPLTDGFLPWTLRAPGLTITDSYLLEIPASLAKGNYQIVRRLSILEPANGYPSLKAPRVSTTQSGDQPTDFD